MATFNNNFKVKNGLDAVGEISTLGNLYANKTTYGFSVVSSAPASITYWKIATLPATSAGTYDHIVLDAILDDNWGSAQKVNAKILFSNRDAFTFRYYLDGTVRSASRILAYTEANGTVSIYLRAGNGNYCTMSYNITHGVDAGTTIHKNPTSTTTTPTGTLVFDSSNTGTYVPQMYIPYSGTPQIQGNSLAYLGANLFTALQTITVPGTVGTNALRLKSTTDGAGNLVNLRFESSNGNLFDMGKNEVSSQSGSFYLYTGSALPIELYNGGTKRLIIESNGNVNIGGGTGDANSLGKLTVIGTSSTAIASLIRGASGQSANLQEWQNNTPTTLASVSSNGSFTAPSLTVSSGGTYTTGSIYADSNWGMLFRARTASPVNAQYRWANSADTELMRLDNSGRLIVSNSFSGSTQGTAQIEARTVNATTIGMIVRGAANQLEDTIEIQNSSGTVLGGINALGQIYSGATAPIQGSTTVAIGTQTPSGTTNITITTGSSHGILVGQTVVIAGVTPTGYNGTWTAQSGTTGTTLIVNIGSNPGVITGAGTVTQNSQLGVVASSANNTPIVIRAAASQAANLSEWRDSSNNNLGWITAGGTLQMANVVSNAAMRANGSLATSSVAAVSIVSNATIGHLVLQNIGTVPNQPSGGGVLYVESGALRYRGTSNAAVTIVNADGTRSLSNPLLTSISTVGGGGSEGGQINFARVTDGAAYWFIDSFGTTSSPDLRFVENATERFRLVAGGAISLGGQTGASGQLLASAGGSSSPTWRNGPVDATTTTATTGFGFMGLPQNATTTGSYTLVAADAGKHIFASATRTVTIPANGSVGFPVGTTITFIAGLGATMTIAITTDTMYLAGAGTTGSRTLAAHGIATAVKTTSTTWIISGNGLT